MSQYAGLSLREIYARKCEELHCKKNSLFYNFLPAKPDLFEIPTHIDLSNNFLGPKGLKPLLEVVRCCTGLMSLNLRDQQLTNESVSEICSAVLHHCSVISLNLSDNPLTIAAGNSLIELVETNHNIEEIFLENTQIRPVMCNAISAKLAKNKQAKAPPEEESILKDMKSAEGVSVSDKATIDQSVARSALASFPSSVADILFDSNPIGALTSLCQKHDALFYDTQFPPEAFSIQRAPFAEYYAAEWRRITHINPQAQIYPEEGAIPMPRDVSGPFSWIFACLSETLEEADIRQLISPATVNPFGVYTVKLFVDGQWRHIVVDDFIPVMSSGTIVFVKPTGQQNNCFWPCIIEKAIAKMHCGYQALDQSLINHHPTERRVSCATTMCDLCGGIGISRDLHHEEFNSEEWWSTLLEMYSRTHLIAVSLKKDTEGMQSQGITPSHAYRILHVRNINGFKLLHLSSQWADRIWTGEWSDKSQLWEQYPHIASALAIKEKADRSFWIPYSSFLQHFASIHLCRTFPQAQTRMLEGEWTKTSAGGPYFEQSWSSNPRYKLSLTSRGSVFINLSVPDSRFYTTEAETLSFHVIKSDYFPIRYDKDNLAARTSYVITNSVSFDGLFAAGDHWIIPSTYVAGKMGRFFLRVFSDSPFVVRHEDVRSWWKEVKLSTLVESSGEYQNGEDNPQYLLNFPEDTEPCRLLAKMHTPESEQYSLALFLTQNTKPVRMLGTISDDSVLAKSKYVISNNVTLDSYIPIAGRSNYVLIGCINPEKTRTLIDMTLWCSHPKFTATELPLWKRKVAKCEWSASGGYQDTARNPQIELVTPIPNMTFSIRMQVADCNDPSILFFVVNNDGRHGDALKGKIPDDRVVMKSTFIRHHTVVKEFHNGTKPASSYVILPCLQPPGSKARCTVTVSCQSDDFQLHLISN